MSCDQGRGSLIPPTVTMDVPSDPSGYDLPDFVQVIPRKRKYLIAAPHSHVQAVQPGSLPLNNDARRLHGTQRPSDSITHAHGPRNSMGSVLRQLNGSARAIIQRRSGTRSIQSVPSNIAAFSGDFSSRVSRMQIPQYSGKSDHYDHQHHHHKYRLSLVRPAAPKPRAYCGGPSHTAV